MNKFQVSRLLILLTFLTYACRKADPKNDPKQRSGLLSIEGFIVNPRPFNNIISLSGTILPNEQIQVRTELAGRIEELNFTEGAFVKKGALLVKVDDSELQAQQQHLDAQIELAKADEQRKKQLIEVNGITQQEYDESVTTVKELDADIALIKTRIYKSSIRAPFDGYVGLRMSSPGAYVSPGDIISTLVETDPAKIEFNVPEKYAGGIKIGMEVTFKLSGKDVKFNGKIYAMDPMIDPSSRALKVRAICGNADKKLVPGAYVELSLELEKINDALMIPTLALVPLLNGQNVYVIKNGKAKLQQISIGTRTENSIQVIQGIQQGDTIAMTGLLAMRNGISVKISKIDTQ